jgi:hypothetical protein
MTRNSHWNNSYICPLSSQLKKTHAWTCPARPNDCMASNGRPTVFVVGSISRRAKKTKNLTPWKLRCILFYDSLCSSVKSGALCFTRWIFTEILVFRDRGRGKYIYLHVICFPPKHFWVVLSVNEFLRNTNGWIVNFH